MTTDLDRNRVVTAHARRINRIGIAVSRLVVTVSERVANRGSRGAVSDVVEKLGGVVSDLFNES
jgi:hypothetical protein